MKPLVKLAVWFCVGALCVSGATKIACADAQAAVHPKVHKHSHERHARARAEPRLANDRSGRTQTGKGSVYSTKFNGKRMANGERFNATSDAAASKTLPLNTVASVTNLQNGRSAIVEIRDRGPFRKDRIIDVSPKVAARLGIGRNGIATVTVVPVSLPVRGG
jgi:rare lipoprotein A